MINYNQAVRYINKGISLFPIQSNKAPIRGYQWTKHRDKLITESELSQYRNEADGYAMVTGETGYEVLDIDLKVCKTPQKAIDFWRELQSLLKDNFDRFDELTIVKTISNGYHIIYRTDTPKGSTKLVHRKDDSGYIVETKGMGGYVVAYDPIQNDYDTAPFLTADERDLLIEVVQFLHEPEHIEQTDYNQVTAENPKRGKTIKTGLPCWDDFNNQHNVFDMVRHAFHVVRRMDDKIIVRKNHFQKSARSGVIFTDSNGLYLFSTDTQYPVHKLLKPFDIYTLDAHNGDYKEAAKQLYKEGYGDRIDLVQTEIEPLIRETIEVGEFPLDVFPEHLSAFITETNKALSLNKDYMAASMLWAASVVMGNLYKVKIKEGWNESPIVWLALVGDKGAGKSPAIKHIIKPLEELNNQAFREYVKMKQAYEDYIDMPKADQKNVMPPNKPKRKQFIVQDVTLEALTMIHSEQTHSLGVFKDELAGWVNDMDKYRGKGGGDMAFWLSSFNNTTAVVNRKTSGDMIVTNPFIPVMGGIQPHVLEKVFSGDNQHNGFMDRFLLVYPKNEPIYFNMNVLDADLIRYFHERINSWMRVTNEIINTRNISENGVVEGIEVEFTHAARNLYQKYFNEMTDIENSDNEIEHIKGIVPKLKTYLSRIALLLAGLDQCFTQDSEYVMLDKIEPEHIERANKLVHYFLDNARKLKVDSDATDEIERIVMKGGDTVESKFMHIYDVQGGKINQTKVAKTLGVSRQTVGRWVKKMSENFENNK